METVKFAGLFSWLNWLETEGCLLTKEKRDVRIRTRAGVTHFGSMESVSASQGQLTIRTYGQHEVLVVQKVMDIAEIDVFRSLRLTSRRAYQEMNEMMRWPLTPPPCALLPGSPCCTAALASTVCPGWKTQQCISVQFDPSKHNESPPLFYAAQH